LAPDFMGQVVALAAMVQAASIVDRVSKSGDYNNTELEPLIGSLFDFEPSSVSDIYGGLEGIKPGLTKLVSIFGAESKPEQHEITRYVLRILYLERKLAKSKDMLAIIRSRLAHTAFKKKHFSGHINETCQSISAVYQDTVSTFRYRIQVTGNPLHLRNNRNADIIRTAIFAGVRSAFLWRQCGGRRWKIILQRKDIILKAKSLSKKRQNSGLH
jgi:high frequency lysogenization protein